MKGEPQISQMLVDSPHERGSGSQSAATAPLQAASITNEPMLGIDYGERRIGVAVANGALAVPLAVIEHINRAEDLERVAAVAREQSAACIVIGLPLHMSGDESEQSRRARRFGSALARRLDVPVVYADERYTSVRASEALHAVPATRARKRGVKVFLDDVAAAMILQGYIDAASPKSRTVAQPQ